MLEKRENTVNCHLFSNVLLKCTFNQAEPKKMYEIEMLYENIKFVVQKYWGYRFVLTLYGIWFKY